MLVYQRVSATKICHNRAPLNRLRNCAGFKMAKKQMWVTASVAMDPKYPHVPHVGVSLKIGYPEI
jgi:hypothetical protein